MMELFSLGADRDAYTEDDIRENARALTGWAADYVDGTGWTNFHFDPDLHDNTNKTVFGHTGNFDWRDSCRLCVENPLHPSFFVEKMWSYFIPAPPSDATLTELTSLYTGGSYAFARCRGDPHAQRLLHRPPIIKPPVVFTASLMRATKPFIASKYWTNSATSPARGCSIRPTSRAGTTGTGSTQTGCGRAGTSPTRSFATAASTSTTARTRRPRPRTWPAVRARSLG